MSEADRLVVVLTTVPDVVTGDALVGQLVEERHIACGNLLPGLSSVYRWGGGVVRESEVLVLMKAPRASVERLFERVAQLHPYEVPELVAMPVEAVSHAYLRWVQQETIEVNE